MGLIDYIKRCYKYYFKKVEIEKELDERQGMCKSCGKCCVMFGIVCPFLNRKTKLCRIYKLRPKILCQIPPLKEDMIKHKPLKCGYYFNKSYDEKKKDAKEIKLWEAYNDMKRSG